MHLKVTRIALRVLAAWCNDHLSMFVLLGLLCFSSDVFSKLLTYYHSFKSDISFPYAVFKVLF